MKKFFQWVISLFNSKPNKETIVAEATNEPVNEEKVQEVEFTAVGGTMCPNCKQYGCFQLDGDIYKCEDCFSTFKKEK